MGIGVNLIPTLLATVQHYRMSGSLLMLGRQDVEANPTLLEKAFQGEGFVPKIYPSTWRADGEHRTMPESFFQALGFTSVESLDVSASEGASIVFDLNAAATPNNLRACCDVLFDGGTLEHVFHLPNALARCTDLIRSDGWFVHIGPMNNYVDHGFYQFSPTFCFDWFTSSKWQMVESVMVRLPSSTQADLTGWSFSFLPPRAPGAGR